jgi:hypothetical protein
MMILAVGQNDFVKRGRKMATSNEPGRSKRLGTQTIALLLIAVLSIVAAGWVMVTVSTTSQLPSSDFVTLPATPLSTTGSKVKFDSVTAIAKGNVAVGVKGYLLTASGAPVAGVPVYMTYYLQGSYRTQVATTNQDGSFQALFPMNWTGWLPVTFTYFGDTQHQGLNQRLNVSGETLIGAP